MSNFIQLGSMAVQFLAEGTIIERGGEFYSVQFVDDCFAYSHKLDEYDMFHIFARNQEGEMCKIETYRGAMFPMYEAVTAEEFEASIS